MMPYWSLAPRGLTGCLNCTVSPDCDEYDPGCTLHAAPRTREGNTPGRLDVIRDATAHGPVTIEAMAQILDVSHATVHKLIRSNQLKTTRGTGAGHPYKIWGVK